MNILKAELRAKIKEYTKNVDRTEMITSKNSDKALDLIEKRLVREYDLIITPFRDEGLMHRGYLRE